MSSFIRHHGHVIVLWHNKVALCKDHKCNSCDFRSAVIKCSSPDHVKSALDILNSESFGLSRDHRLSNPAWIQSTLLHIAAHILVAKPHLNTSIPDLIKIVWIGQDHGAGCGSCGPKTQRPEHACTSPEDSCDAHGTVAFNVANGALQMRGGRICECGRAAHPGGIRHIRFWLPPTSCVKLHGSVWFFYAIPLYASHWGRGEADLGLGVGANRWDCMVRQLGLHPHQHRTFHCSVPVVFERHYCFSLLCC